MKRMMTVFLALAALGVSQAMEKEEGLKVGTVAPVFKVTDLAGNEFDLAQAKGRVVFLDFWATWCPPCRAALPHTNEIAARKEVKDGKLLVLALDLKEAPAKVSELLKEQKLTFRCAVDSKGKIAEAYKVDGIPTFAVVGRDGKIVWYGCGYDPDTTGKDIDKAIDAALAKK